MKRVLTIRIEVDMDSPKSEEWNDKEDFFTNEVDEVLSELSSIRNNPRYVKSRSKNGTTDTKATQYQMKFFKSNKPLTKYFEE